MAATAATMPLMIWYFSLFLTWIFVFSPSAWAGWEDVNILNSYCNLRGWGGAAFNLMRFWIPFVNSYHIKILFSGCNWACLCRPQIYYCHHQSFIFLPCPLFFVLSRWAESGDIIFLEHNVSQRSFLVLWKNSKTTADLQFGPNFLAVSCTFFLWFTRIILIITSSSSIISIILILVSLFLLQKIDNICIFCSLL